MNILHTSLDILLPLVAILFFFLFYPFYLLIKLVIFLYKQFLSENVAGKVVLITGASSGIGEHVAYEYAKKGAYLALVARREDRLEIVAETSRQLGSDDVIIIPGDVAKVEDCKKFIDETIRHFGKLDHPINNAGVVQTVVFEDYNHIQDANLIMASKAALLRFFETLRIELNPDIKITIVFPGVVATDMTTPRYIENYGSDFIFTEPVSRCAKGIFNGICRGETYIEEPSWMKWIYVMKNMCPEIVEYVLHDLYFRYLKPSFERD
ncbi:11-beta-hydroxysteroid dehydrogenase-like 3 isoform X2 [Raphanus sativus]|uniref:11-beta-hydroxysteroid dehydrogenase-like 3 isoform X2 n=1 Tax=Raphanus sativus TaxID=3726 RepID=A0A6J0MBW5_RAPSA|nr:11-beta-hydroxysteroid dehydrogenase-like 3 isoform X2 [Raphanus sativus]